MPTARANCVNQSFLPRGRYYTGLQSHAGLGCVQAPRRLRASMALVLASLVHTGTSQ